MHNKNDISHYFDWTTYPKQSLEYLLKDFLYTRSILIEEYENSVCPFYFKSNFIKENRYIREIELRLEELNKIGKKVNQD